MVSCHRVYLANRGGRPFSQADRRSLLAILNEQVLGLSCGATLLEATGVWAGRLLPTLVIQIAGEEPAVRGLAQRLRRRFGQQAIGVECGGSFEIIRGGA